MATQTFLFPGIDGSAALSRRLGDAYAGGLAGPHQLVRVGLAALGSEEVVSQGDEVLAVFASPRACADVAIQMQRALVVQAWPGTRRC